MESPQPANRSKARTWAVVGGVLAAASVICAGPAAAQQARMISVNGTTSCLSSSRCCRTWSISPSSRDEKRIIVRIKIISAKGRKRCGDHLKHSSHGS